MSVLFVNDERVTSLPDGWGAFTAHRTSTWRWVLMDRSLRVTGELGDARDAGGNVVPSVAGVTDGSLTFNVNADTRGSGSVTWVGRAEDQPDWINIRIQPWYSMTAPDGAVVSWPLGVFIPSTPRIVYNDGGWVQVQVDLFDRTLHLRQRVYRYGYTVRKGDSLIAHARDTAATAARPSTVMIEDDPATARTPMVFPPGSTFMEAMSALLEAAGFFAVYADGEGMIRSGKYVRPQDRPVAWEFIDGQNAIFKSGFEVEYDWFDVPNRVQAYSQATGDDPPLHAEAVNDDPADPLSTVNRGIFDDPRHGVEAADLATLQSYADRVMAEHRNRNRGVQLEHLPLPLMVNDRVNFRFDAAGVSLPGVLQTLNITCKPRTLWRSELREVVA